MSAEKILETGTIEEVLKKSRPRHTVAVRVLDGQNAGLLKSLLETPFVENAREVFNEVHFELAGDEAMACDILGGLIAQRIQNCRIPADQGQSGGYLHDGHQGRRAMNCGYRLKTHLLACGVTGS